MRKLQKLSVSIPKLDIGKSILFENLQQTHFYQTQDAKNSFTKKFPTNEIPKRPEINKTRLQKADPQTQTAGTLQNNNTSTPATKNKVDVKASLTDSKDP
jgi:hypothetical protein